MDKLLNAFDRGFDLVNDDFRFLDDSIRTALKDICLAIGIDNPTFILHGCQLTVNGTVASVTEGAIYFNNEIWHVAAHNFAVPNPLPGPPFWTFIVSNDPAGIKLDKDLVQHNTYQLRRAVGTATGAAAGAIASVEIDQVPKMKDLLFGNSGPEQLSFKQYPNVTIQGRLDVRKSNGLIFITGNVDFISDLNVPAEIAILPGYYKPSIQVAGYTLGICTNNGSIIIVGYQIDVDGKLSMFIAPNQAQLTGQVYGYNAAVNIIYPL